MRSELESVHKVFIEPVYTWSHDVAYYYVVEGDFIAAGGGQKSLNNKPLLKIRNGLFGPTKYQIQTLPKI